MPTSTYVGIANLTLGSSAATVTFSSISQAYRDLVLVIVARNTTTPTNVYARFNSDTGSNYATVYMKGNGSTATSGGGADVYMPIGVTYATANTFDITTFQIMDYSATDKHKSGLSRAGNAYSEGAVARATRWANTAAVTTITLSLDSNSFESGSTFALYGIAS